jgi:hypothetical protein
VDWYQSAFVHDEYQCPVKEHLAPQLGAAIVDGCSMIKDQFNMNLVISADFDKVFLSDSSPMSLFTNSRE